MRVITLLLFLSFYTSSFSKTINTNKIISVSDSILVSKVGEELKKYFVISDEGSHYKYFVTKNKISTESLLSRKKINDDFTEIWILYYFNYSEIKGMKSGIWMKLNNKLELIEPLNLNSVPNFLIKKEPSTFLPVSSAKQIAQKFCTKSSELSEPKLKYVKKLEKYIYSISNKTAKLKSSDTGEIEIVEIDAFTGDFLSKYKNYDGLIVK